MSETLPARVAVAPDILFQELEGESVLFNMQTDHYFGLDDVGTEFWRLLAQHGEVEPVVAQLLADYGHEVDEATLRRDLADLIDQLVDAGLLTVPAAE